MIAVEQSAQNVKFLGVVFSSYGKHKFANALVASCSCVIYLCDVGKRINRQTDIKIIISTSNVQLFLNCICLRYLIDVT